MNNPGPDPKHTPQRYEFLDSVRGVAALVVFFQHAIGYHYPVFNDFRRDWFDLGLFGVVVFFLTSGFIIPESLHRVESVPRFLFRRFFRLYPLYWLSLAGAVVFHLGGFSPGHHTESEFRAHLGWNTLVNLTMFQEFVGVPDAIRPYWTLTVELLFYFTCSLLFLLKVRDPLTTHLGFLGFGFLAGVVVPLATGRRIPMGIVFFLMTMFFGTVLHQFHSGRVRWKALAIHFALLLAVASTGSYLNFYHYRADTPGGNTLTSVALTWCASYLFFGWLFIRRHRANPRFFIGLGVISYSLYLMHHVVVFALIPAISVPLPRPLSILLALLISIGLSIATFRLVETPGIRLGRWLEREWMFGVVSPRTRRGLDTPDPVPWAGLHMHHPKRPSESRGI